jgi:hypothetical protein
MVEPAGRLKETMNLTDEFQALIAALQGANVEYAVCGGMAMALHGYPRLTKDIDLLVLAADLPRVIAVAKQCGFDDDSGILTLGAAGPNPCQIHRVNKFQGEDHLILDLILVAPTLENVWAGRTQFEWQGQILPVVAAAGLARMKALAGRSQDIADIEALGFQKDDPAIQP